MYDSADTIALSMLAPGDTFEATLTGNQGTVLKKADARQGILVVLQGPEIGRSRYLRPDLRVIPRGRALTFRA